MSYKLSIVICTYNGEKHISDCLNAILIQNEINFEIICCDGGSTDRTKEIVKDYIQKHRNIKLLHNKKQYPEGYGKGKWLGLQNAEGEIILFLDQDNIIGKDFLKESLKPFENKEISGVAYRVLVDKNDNLTNRYVALLGTDPFLAYRSLDGLIYTNKLNMVENENYYILELSSNNFIVTGGNSYFYRKKDLDFIGGYYKDVENVYRLIKRGKNKIAIPKKVFTHHNATTGFFNFVKKKKRWAKHHDDNKGAEFSWFPKTKIERREFIKNLFFCFTILPYFIIFIKKFIQSKEPAWLLHAPLAFITLFIYINHTFLRKR